MRKLFWLAVLCGPMLISCARHPAAPPAATVATVAPTPTALPAPTPAPTPTARPLILEPFEGAPPPPRVVSLHQDLLVCAAAGDIAGIKAALARGADINVVEDQSKAHTPLTYAAENGHVAATRYLLRHGANPDGGAPAGGPRLSPLFWTVENGQTECVRLLLRAGADPDRTCVDSNRPIDFAATRGDVAIVEMLIGRMRWPGNVRRYRMEARNVWLNRVVSGGTTAQVRAALAAGGDVNNLDASNENGTASPLMRAAERADLTLMRLLLKRGARVNLRDSQGRSALMFIGSSNTYEGQITPGATRADVTRLLLRAGADLTLRDTSGMTALMYAAQGNAAASELLIERGARVNARDEGERTALHFAASVRDDRSIAVLLRHGAPVNARDIEGASALMRASVHPDAPAKAAERAARLRALRLLKRAGADPKLEDKQGETAADYSQLQDQDFVSAG